MTFPCIEYGKNSDETDFYKKLKNKCDDCSNKISNCQLCGKDFLQKKWLNSHIEREHENEFVF